MKKFLLVIMSIVMVFSLSACNQKEEKVVETTDSSINGNSESVTYQSQPAFVGDEDESYAFVSWYAGNEWWVGGYEGFKDAARELGVKTTCTGATDDAIDNQLAVFSQVVALKPDGICLAVSEGSPFGNDVQNAIDEGIPVTTTDNDIEGANTLMFIAYNDDGMTKLVADHIGEALNGKGKIAILETVGQANLELRAASFKQNLAKYWPNIKIVATANSGHDAVKATSDTTTILSSNPDLDFIFTLNADSAMGAVISINDISSKCKVITMDVNGNVLDYIKEGKIDAAIMPDSYTFGYMSMLALYCQRHELLDPMWAGNKGKNLVDVPYMEVGSTIVTSENADKYYTSKYYDRRDSKGFEEGAQDMTSKVLPGYWVR
jgi:ribose transport system substrate-binding protein